MELTLISDSLYDLPTPTFAILSGKGDSLENLRILSNSVRTQESLKLQPNMYFTFTNFLFTRAAKGL